MKYRDLEKYVELLTGKKREVEIGNDNEPLFVDLYGKRGSVKHKITTIASFAGNIHEQIFYEFVQNAYDADADSLMFFANEKYLIVVNNGKPFYTDQYQDDRLKNRPGQLYEFLGKEKSAKSFKENNLGYYGQGSKLLYKLMLDNSNTSDEEQLKKTIYYDKKGPYIISWSNDVQWQNFVSMPQSWESGDPLNEKDNLLVAKIVYGYYPIAPTQNEELFSRTELNEIILTFDELISPRRNHNLLKQGAAIVIPLGKGKSDMLLEENNLEKLEKRLGGFAALISESKKQHSKLEKKIEIFSRQIINLKAHSIRVNFEEESEKFNFHFAFNKEFVNKDYVSLYKHLPITNTCFRLGYLIDCAKFEVDDGRQRITNEGKTQNQLIKAYEKLIDELEKIPRIEYQEIYNAIISSRPNNNDVLAFIKDSFKAVIVPYLKENIATNAGEFIALENVRQLSGVTDPKVYELIELEKWGIDDFSWLDYSKKIDFNHHGITINEITWAELLSLAEPEMLKEWISRLSFAQYTDFINYLEDVVIEEEELSSLPLYRTNKNQILSYDNLVSDNQVLFFNGEYDLSENILKIYPEAEYFVLPFNIENADSVLFDKLLVNHEYFRASRSGVEMMCQLLSVIAKNNNSLEKQIKSELPIFKNRQGEYKPFNQLFASRPENTVLFDDFLMVGNKPESLNDNWFINTPHKTWNWLKENWDTIIALKGWGQETDYYLEDITSISSKIQSSIGQETIQLFLSKEGIPVEYEQFKISGAYILTSNEYQLMEDCFHAYNFIPLKYFKKMRTPPFSFKSLRLSDLIEEKLVEYELLPIFIKLESNFFNQYQVEITDNQFNVKEVNNASFYYLDVENHEIQEVLSEYNYLNIPASVVSLIPANQIDSFSLIKNSQKMERLIDQCNSYDLLILYPVIKQCNWNIVKQFYNKLRILEINERINAADVKWQVILDAEYYSENDTLRKVIMHNDQSLPATIKSKTLHYNGTEYNLYELLDEIQTNNSIIDSFLNCLPNPQYFKDKFYANQIEETDASEVFDEISSNYLSIYQLNFCLDYSLTENVDIDDLELEESEDLSDALKMIYEKKYTGFDEHFKIPDFDKNTQVLAASELLLEHEILPEALLDWFHQHSDAISLIDGLLTESVPVIALRKAISGAVFYQIFESDLESYPSKTKDTLNWVIEQELSIIHESELFKTIFRLIEQLPEGHEPLLFMKYSGEISKDNDGVIYPVYNLEEFNEDSYFYSSFNVSQDFKKMVEANDRFKSFLKHTSVYLYRENDLLPKHNLHKHPKLTVKSNISLLQGNEWANPVYLEWKKQPVSNGITIKLTSTDINILFQVTSNDEELFSEHLISKDIGYTDDLKTIMVKCSTDEVVEVRTKLSERIEDISFFKTPFIALMSMLMDSLEKIQEDLEGKLIVELKEGLDTNQVKDIFSNLTQQKLDRIKETIESDEAENRTNLPEELLRNLENLDVEQIKLLLKHKDKLKRIIAKILEDELQEDESLVRKTIGYIGELIFERYLRDISSISYNYAAAEQIGEYDFSVDVSDSNQLYIDVKTNLYSLKDGTAPFYLHKSQNRFMQENPESEYRIVRISLTDLKLEKSYRHIRDLYGAEADPAENEALKKACIKLVDNYWKKAKVDEFIACSPEYAIRIEQQKKRLLT